jgi:hypothetical protein
MPGQSSCPKDEALRMTQIGRERERESEREGTYIKQEQGSTRLTHEHGHK